MTDFNMLMQKAREMQEKLMRQQRDLAQKEITGTSGGGMIEIVMTGKGEVKRVKIDPSLVDPDDVAVLEDLLTAAFNDARKKIETETADGLSDILPPGMKMPF